MAIKIHGKDYQTVAERLKASHDLEDLFGVETEIIKDTPVVVIKATIHTSKGSFTGISAANPAKSIEKLNPYEVAETSAVGRALAFAGYASSSEVASSDEMKKKDYIPKDGMSIREFAQIRNDYANKNVQYTLDQWEKMNFEQRKTLHQLKLTKEANKEVEIK